MSEIIEPSVPMDPACKLFRDGDKNYRTQTLLSKIWIPMVGAFLPISGVVINNIIGKRPLYSSMHRIIFGGVCGFALGLYAKEWKYKMQAERDLMIYHYMTLHPEDFPPPERIKYRDVLTEWVPIR